MDSEVKPSVRPTLPAYNAELMVSVLNKIMTNEFEFTRNELQAVEDLYLNLYAIVSRREIKVKIEQLKNLSK